MLNTRLDARLDARKVHLSLYYPVLVWSICLMAGAHSKKFQLERFKIDSDIAAERSGQEVSDLVQIVTVSEGALRPPPPERVSAESRP